jgi:hypothetical protein
VPIPLLVPGCLLLGTLMIIMAVAFYDEIAFRQPLSVKLDEQEINPVMVYWALRDAVGREGDTFTDEATHEMDVVDGWPEVLFDEKMSCQNPFNRALTHGNEPINLASRGNHESLSASHDGGIYKILLG